MGIILENMRREGYELEVNCPEVVFQTKEDGTILEPIEKIKVEIPLTLMAQIMDKFNKRLGEVKKTIEKDDQTSLLIVEIPTRGLFGLQAEVMTEYAYDMKFESEFLGY